MSECCHPGKLHLAPGWENGTGLFVIDRHLVETWQATPALIATIAKWDTSWIARGIAMHWWHQVLARGDKRLIGHQLVIQMSNKCQDRRKIVSCMNRCDFIIFYVLLLKCLMKYTMCISFLCDISFSNLSCSARVSIPQMLDNRRMAGCGSSDEDPYRFKVESRWSRWWNELWCNGEDALRFKFCSENDNDNSGHTRGLCFFYCFDA